MTYTERLSRIDEVEAYTHHLTINTPFDYLNYHYKRTTQLDAMAPSIAVGEVLDVIVGDSSYRVRVEAQL